MSLTPGAKLGSYEILSLLGAGGMGEVYLAQDTKLKRRVALKFLAEDLTRDETRKQRFIQEARAAAAIEHPHIAAIYDIDEAEGRTFIAMEYVRGQSLREAIRSQQLSVRRSLELGFQIADGLAKAHERGVVHRDIKPENVLLSEDGYAKVIDFGLAKLVEPLAEPDAVSSEAETETRLKTREGVFLGTAAYMSPEQAKGDTVDARSDIFSFGAVLYEMLSGQCPFLRGNVVKTLDAVLHESPPPLSAATGESRPDVERVLRKALSKDLTERYQSMKDLAIELRELRDEAMSAEQPATAARRRKLSWLWPATVGLTLAAVIAWVLLARDRSPPGIGASGRPAIAVMYFEDHTGSEEIRWLSKGVPSMLLTDLAQTPGLDVVSSERIHEILKQVGQDNVEVIDKALVSEIAQRSGAGAVVVGNIFKAGSDIRIDVQVEDVRSGHLLTAASVRGNDVFLLVEDLAGRVRQSLTLSDSPAIHPLTEVTTPSLDAYRFYSQGVEARYNARYAEARALFEEAVKLDPAFALAHFRLFQVVRVWGEMELSRAYADNVRQYIDRLPERQKLLFQAELAEDPREAVKILEALIARYPDELEAYLLLDRFLREVREPEKQLHYAQRGVHAFPESGHMHNQYGYALLERGYYSEAIQEFQTYARLSPEEPNALDSLGEAHLVVGRPEEALRQYAQALTVAPFFSSSLVGRSWAAGMLGRYDDTLSDLAKLKSLGPRANQSSTTSDFLLAFAHSRVGRYRTAEAALERSLLLIEVVADPFAEVDGHLLRALLALERRNYAVTLENVGRAQRAMSTVSSESYRRRMTLLGELLAGTAEVRLGRREAAHARLEAQQERYDSDDVREQWWHHALAGEIHLADGDFAAAEAAFSEGETETKMYISMADPTASVFANNLTFRDGLARVKRARGDLGGAIEIYRNLNTPHISHKWTAMLEPRYVLAAARLLDETGDEKAARDEYQRFLELWKDADPDLPELSEAREYLAR